MSLHTGSELDFHKCWTESNKHRGKVVPVLFFNRAPRHWGDCRFRSTHSLTLALDGGEWSASHPGCLTPRDRAPGTHSPTEELMKRDMLEQANGPIP
jgi:hypothetical protein